jgi:hypothetical protein
MPLYGCGQRRAANRLAEGDRGVPADGRRISGESRLTVIRQSIADLPFQCDNGNFQEKSKLRAAAKNGRLATAASSVPSSATLPCVFVQMLKAACTNAKVSAYGENSPSPLG